MTTPATRWQQSVSGNQALFPPERSCEGPAQVPLVHPLHRLSGGSWSPGVLEPECHQPIPSWNQRALQGVVKVLQAECT